MDSELDNLYVQAQLMEQVAEPHLRCLCVSHSPVMNSRSERSDCRREQATRLSEHIVDGEKSSPFTIKGSALLISCLLLSHVCIVCNAAMLLADLARMAQLLSLAP